MLTPAGLLVAWGNAVLRGDCSPDAAAEVVTRCGGVGPVLDAEVATLPMLFATWRSTGVAGVRLVQPVPGDPVQRLGPVADAAALDAGAAAVVLGDGPALVHHAVGPRRGWQVIAVPDPVAAPPVQSMVEADRLMRATVRSATELLAGLGTADAADPVLTELHLLRERPPSPLPPGHPPAAVAVLAVTERLRPMVALAAAHDPTVSREAARARQRELTAVADALRRAETAAVDAGIPMAGTGGGRR